MLKNSIIELQKEVADLELKHKNSLLDETISIDEKSAIADQYTSKYKELMELTHSEIQSYSDLN